MTRTCIVDDTTEKWLTSVEEYTTHITATTPNSNEAGVPADEYTCFVTAHILKVNIMIVFREPHAHWPGGGQVVVQGAAEHNPTLPTIILWHTGSIAKSHISPITGLFESAGTRNGFNRTHFQLLGHRKDKVSPYIWINDPMPDESLCHLLINVASSLLYECDHDGKLLEDSIPPLVHIPEFRLVFNTGVCTCAVSTVNTHSCKMDTDTCMTGQSRQQTALRAWLLQIARTPTTASFP